MALQERIPKGAGAALGPLVERVFHNDALSGPDGSPARLNALRRPIVALNRSLFCTEVKSAPILRDSFPSATTGYVGYRARLFDVTG